MMLNDRRAFIDAIRTWCNRRAISVDTLSGGWIVAMRRGAEQYFTYGYDLGLNSSVAHRIANDKAATAEILERSGIACVPHSVFLRPELNAYIPPTGSWEAMLGLLQASPHGLVVKPNEGTSGHLVFKVLTRPQLELAVNAIFVANLNIAVAPYLGIADEVRVVLLDDQPVIVYSKQRPSVVGDGVRSIIDLALTSMTVERLSTVLSGTGHNLDQATLAQVLPAGQAMPLHWRHNLDSGAEPIMLEHGEPRDSCVRVAMQAARSIGLRFGSIDVVLVDGVWRVLEINSGVMMEQLNKLHPDLVEAAYSAALDRVFGNASAT